MPANFFNKKKTKKNKLLDNSINLNSSPTLLSRKLGGFATPLSIPVENSPEQLDSLTSKLSHIDSGFNNGVHENDTKISGVSAFSSDVNQNSLQNDVKYDAMRSKNLDPVDRKSSNSANNLSSELSEKYSSGILSQHPGRPDDSPECQIGLGQPMRANTVGYMQMNSINNLLKVDKSNYRTSKSHENLHKKQLEISKIRPNQLLLTPMPANATVSIQNPTAGNLKNSHFSVNKLTQNRSRVPLVDGNSAFSSTTSLSSSQSYYSYNSQNLSSGALKLSPGQAKLLNQSNQLLRGRWGTAVFENREFLSLETSQ